MRSECGAEFGDFLDSEDHVVEDGRKSPPGFVKVLLQISARGVEIVPAISSHWAINLDCHY